jgi:putative DNA methylase
MDKVRFKSPRKLIEVALPLSAINAESLRRKQKAPKGWPTSFHKWWAQRPLAAARAVLFAQLVNDPGFQQGQGYRYGKNKRDAARERRRLFDLMAQLITWENSTNTELIDQAEMEIRRSWREVCELNRDHPEAATLFDPAKPPTIRDPFAGAGTIPLEGQRLRLPVSASDLNPVAVVIEKALLELPYIFKNQSPVSGNERRGRIAEALGSGRPNAFGLAEDVRYYGQWLRSQAFERIGELYPPVQITRELAANRADLRPYVDRYFTVVAWIWARTVASPNPAAKGAHVPLVTSFLLSSRAEHSAYVEPTVDGTEYSFRVKIGVPSQTARAGTKLGRGTNFRCLISGTPIEDAYVKAESIAGRMGARLMAAVIDTSSGRRFVSPTEEMARAAAKASAHWKPEQEMNRETTDLVSGRGYGFYTWADLFTSRQLAGITTFCDLVVLARAKIKQDAIRAGLADDGLGLNEGGMGAKAYAEAVCVYLACAVDRMIYYGSSLTTWLPKDSALRDCMPRQALAMAWDFAESNPFGKSSGDVATCIASVSNYLDVATPNASATAFQHDAQHPDATNARFVYSTDPPYYNNIGYADLSDYFYVWLRPMLRDVFPALFATLLVPKAEELVATPYRHGGRDKAEDFFLQGMTNAMRVIAEKSHPAVPVTIYYAYKQSDSEDGTTQTSTGWETFLEAVIRAGFTVTGTWPMRTEGAGRLMANETNALASSIILVCRKRDVKAPTLSRREFLRELNSVLPDHLDEMTSGVDGDLSRIAPVDLSQAIIGPGIGVFSKYSAVLEADGSHMSVRAALQSINRFFAQEDFDHDSQFCLQWFQEYQWNDGLFGDAEVLARAKGTSVDGVKHAGVIESGAGKVRLLKWSEYPADWNPATDTRMPIWEVLHQIIRAHRTGGDSAASHLLGATKGKAEAARQLAYRLYTWCERSGSAEDARAYNEIITSWSAIESAAGKITGDRDLFGDSL